MTPSPVNPHPLAADAAKKRFPISNMLPTLLVSFLLCLSFLTTMGCGGAEPPTGTESNPNQIDPPQAAIEEAQQTKIKVVSDATYTSLTGLTSGGDKAQKKQRMTVESLGIPLELECNITGMHFRLVPSGERNGSKVNSPFYLAMHEVTNGQFLNFLNNSGYDYDYDRKHLLSGNDFPVSHVSWKDAMAFCEWLSQQTGQNYTLPTEAQWEYACGAGSTDDYCFGNDKSKLGEYAVYAHYTTYGSQPVGGKKANAFGLHDMHGNLREWLLDYPAMAFSIGSSEMKPFSDRLLKGGSWKDRDHACDTDETSSCNPDWRFNDHGFRVCLLSYQ